MLAKTKEQQSSYMWAVPCVPCNLCAL